MAKPPRVKNNPRQTPPRPLQHRTVAISNHQWSGPLPPPAALAEFDRIVPNGAERIFRMAEIEQQHRISLESRGQAASIKEARRGQILGWLISIGSVIGAVVCVFLEAHWSVIALLVGVPIMGLAKAIVSSRSHKQD